MTSEESFWIKIAIENMGGTGEEEDISYVSPAIVTPRKTPSFLKEKIDQKIPESVPFCRRLLKDFDAIRNVPTVYSDVAPFYSPNYGVDQLFGFLSTAGNVFVFDSRSGSLAGCVQLFSSDVDGFSAKSNPATESGDDDDNVGGNNDDNSDTGFGAFGDSDAEDNDIDGLTHTCHVCQLCFTQARDLRRHHQRLHGGERKHACPHCEKRFGTGYVLRRHIRTVHFHAAAASTDDTAEQQKRPTHACSDCAKTFACASQLRLHRTIHTGEKRHECDECGKRFGRNSYLLAHKRTHSEKRPFGCPQCGMTFKLACHLRSHQIRHTQERPPPANADMPRPYVCQFDQCGKGFVNNNELQRHTKVHTGEREFACPLCQKTFKHHGDCNRHLRRTHQLEQERTPKERSRKPAKFNEFIGHIIRI